MYQNIMSRPMYWPHLHQTVSSCYIHRLTQKYPNMTKQFVEDHFEGNLCRCTGKPILTTLPLYPYLRLSEKPRCI